MPEMSKTLSAPPAETVTKAGKNQALRGVVTIKNFVEYSQKRRGCFGISDENILGLDFRGKTFTKTGKRFIKLKRT